LRLKLRRHKQFLKDLKKIRMSDAQFQKYVEYLSLLANDRALPPEARDHGWKGFREFHVGGYPLVIYRKVGEEVVLVRIGGHGRIFE